MINNLSWDITELDMPIGFDNNTSTSKHALVRRGIQPNNGDLYDVPTSIGRLVQDWTKK